jgi:AraC-like DNA-binding protein
MDYFSNITFPLVDSYPEYRDIVNREPIYYGIQFNYSGPLELCINHGKVYRSVEPCAFITSPGKHFRYGTYNSQPRHHSFICMYGERIHDYIRGGLLEPDRTPPLIRVAYPQKFLETIYEIKTLTSHGNTVNPHAVLLLEKLLLHLYESGSNQILNKPYQAKQLMQLIDEIQKTPQKHFDFNNEAKKHNITTIHFRRIFKSLTGSSPQQFLIRNRLRYAASLLVETSSPINIIGAEAGFDNPFYFTRIFKKMYWVSPKEYRKEFVSDFHRKEVIASE